MTTYFTSDLHLGHENILYSRTQFKSIEEMDKHIIQRWNETVKKTDEVYILGDMMFRNKKSPHYYLNQLNGKKHLIIGNHDNDWMRKMEIDELYSYFASVSTEQVIKINHIRYTLSHYPWIEFQGSRYAKADNSSAYMIHGHIHDKKDDTYKIIKEYLPFNLNCGQDICDFRPVTIEELIEINKKWYQRR